MEQNVNSTANNGYPVGMGTPNLPEAQATEEFEEDVHVGAYRFLSILVFLLAAGGLFLGLLATPLKGTAAQLFRHSILYTSDGKLGGSLLGFCIATFRGIPQALSPFSLRKYACLILAAFLALSVVVSLICLIVSFVSERAARGSAMCGLYFVLTAYGALFVLAFYYACRSAESLGWAVIDGPSMLISAALLLFAVIASLGRSKTVGLCNLLGLLFSLAAIFALFYPKSYTVGQIAPLTIATVKSNIIGLLALIVAAVAVFNAVLSLYRLNAKRGKLFDLVRFSLMLALVVALIIVSVVKSQDRAAFFSTSLIPSITLIVAAVGGFMLALMVFILRGKKKEEEAPAVAVTPAPVAVESAPVAQPVAETPMSEFERRMLDLAAGKSPISSESTPYAPTDLPDGYMMGQGSIMQGGSSRRTYDYFMSTLTDEEYKQFGDLFIEGTEGRYGDLPTYEPGGDNTKFFDLIVIYYGFYAISPSLLAKIFAHAKKHRK